MPRAVGPARVKPGKPSSHRNQKNLRRSQRTRARLRPSAPRVSPAQLAQQWATAHEAARATAWGTPGEVRARFGAVEVWSAAQSNLRPHWHLVTQGLWKRGYELSLRVVRGREEVAPPDWAMALVQRQVQRALSDDAVPPDATWCLEEPEPMAPESELGALTLTGDAVLPALEAPHGRATVWQLVPMTRDEARLVREWSPSGLVELLRVVDPLLVADPERGSLLQSPRARMAIEQRVAREGSSLGAMQAKVSSLTRAKAQATWRLSADAVDGVIALLKGRTAHQRPFVVRGMGVGVEVRPGDAPAVELGEGPPVLKLSQAASRQLRAQLRAKPGRYAIDALPGFTIEVV